ncbi:heat shock transcription factor, X-linked member 3-like [Cynocephalus volans]|uniref:heat shock transcription factor, X-linked member 3-like n=1 Tax=Cynocephalus volans TaxID=110931 RepID=UPI002FCA6A32
MDSQDTDDSETELASSSGGEPASRVPRDPNLDPREVSDGPGDQAVGQDADSQNDEQPADQNQRASSVEKDSDPRTLSFPRRLWKIVEDDAFESVHWDDDGHTVIIEQDLFQREILRRRGVDRIFETDSMKTFICQMNRYGFSKIRPKASSADSRGNKKLMLNLTGTAIFRDQPGLLENIHSKGDLRNTAPPATCAPTTKRKKLVPTRQSLRIQHINAKKEANSKSQAEAPNVQGPSNPQFSMFRGGTRSRSSVARHPIGNRPPQEPNDPSRREVTSVKVRCEPRADTGMEGAGDPVPNLPLYPGNGFRMSMYCIYYPIRMASLLVTSPIELPNNEEQEGSSECTCAFCEQFKDNPGL